MFRFLIMLFVLNFCNFALSSPKEKVISKMKLTNNLSFNFIQTINDKSENGYCIIKYPKKIFCEYNNANKKILVSNGKSLVIKNRVNNNSYIYPLKKTPLELLLDKNYLISKINILEAKDIDNKYINFKIFENNNEINIFFDKKTFNLIGWQTEDIYQNLTITFISSVKINQKLDGTIFNLPENN
jgi:outer membrane lipoprotein-sorting protein